MCKECERIKLRIRTKRVLFEVIKETSSQEYIRGFRNGQTGLLDDDESNKEAR